MNKTIRILLLSVLITIAAAACGMSGISLEEEGVETATEAPAEAAPDADDALAQNAAGTTSENVALANAAEAVTAAGTEPVTDAQASEAVEPQGTVCVYVCGEVVTPGVYELAEGARIYEALTLAGGLSADADITVVNQAQVLTDGMMIRIPAMGESAGETPVLSGGTDTAAAAESTAGNDGSAGLVNINTADADTLCTLPGIGAAKAATIIAYREQNGSYTSKEDLMNVSGIGDATYRNLESRITVGP